MKNKKLYFIAIGIFLVGIIVGSFLDLEINTALYSPKNAFGLGFAAFAPFFGYAFFVLFGGIVHRFAIKDKNIYVKIALFALSAFSIVASTYLSSKEVTSINGFNIPDWRWLAALIEGILFIPFFFVGDRYGKKTDNKAILIAMLILVGFMIIDLVPFAQIVKNVMRRPRYRVLAEGLYENKVIFMNWWQPYKAYGSLFEKFGTTDSFSEQFKSFPSGHTSVAAILIFGLPYLSLIEPKLKGKENLLFSIGLVFTILMAFSRMTVGAHYLSDVSFGGLVMVICCMFANEINLKYFLFKEKEKQE